MSESSLKERQFKELCNLAYHLITYQKKDKNEVMILLIQKGMDEEKARSVVNNVIFYMKEKSDNVRKDLEWGMVFFLFGIVVFGVTYLIFQFTGFYIVSFGAIIYGAILYIRGMLNKENIIS
jgi:hypothetical protein